MDSLTDHLRQAGSQAAAMLAQAAKEYADHGSLRLAFLLDLIATLLGAVRD